MQPLVPLLRDRDSEFLAISQPVGLAAVGLVVNDAGRVLLNLRDDKPTIAHRNKWSLLGGKCDPGENEVETVRRELFEEAGIVVDGDPTPLWRFVDLDGSRHLITAFLVLTSMTLGEMQLAEGQDLRFFDLAELAGLDLTPFAAALLERHFSLGW